MTKEDSSAAAGISVIKRVKKCAPRDEVWDFFTSAFAGMKAQDRNVDRVEWPNPMQHLLPVIAAEFRCPRPGCEYVIHRPDDSEFQRRPMAGPFVAGFLAEHTGSLRLASLLAASALVLAALLAASAGSGRRPAQRTSSLGR